MTAQNSFPNSKRRVPGRPFQPGQSGNPGGRPKESEEFRRWLREKFAAPEERQNLWDRAQESDYLMAKLLEHAHGKPPQDVRVEGEIHHVSRIIDIGPDGRRVVHEVERQTLGVPGVTH